MWGEVPKITCWVYPDHWEATVLWVEMSAASGECRVLTYLLPEDEQQEGVPVLQTFQQD
jgi:hypothetical protein